MPGSRFIVVSYLPLFFLGAAIGNIIGQDALRGLFLVLATFYIATRVATAWIEGRFSRWRIRRRDWMKAGLLLYTALYGVLFFPRAFPGVVGVTSAPTLFIHAAFWILVYSDAVYRGRPRLLAKDIAVGVLAGFITGLLLTFQAAGWDLRPGQIHNLSGMDLVRSDVDVPMLTIILTFIAVGWVVRYGTYRGGPDRWYRWRKAAMVGVVILFGVLVTFYLYSRRTPILAVIGGLSVMLLPLAAQRRLVWFTPAMAFVPLFWTALVPLLLRLTQNPFVDAILARNDPEHYLTATYRLSAWQAGLEFMSDLRLQHLWGYGGSDILGITMAHTHNVVLQLFFDAGAVTLAVAGVLVIGVFTTLGKLLERESTRREGAIMMGLFVAWIVLGAVEPTLRQVSMGHLLFLTLAAYATQRAHDTVAPTNPIMAEAG